MPRKSPPSKEASSRVRLRPHNPFDLIRLLARSQTDPRKAVAELVQNSLDAGAQNIELTWFTREKQRALCIRDDGDGPFPDLSRGDALRRLAHTIGHSHKRNLTPLQRREQMVQGQYGIGLIGFWSVGHTLHMRTKVGTESAWTLQMFEDKPQAVVKPSRTRLVDDAQSWTEVTIFGVHPASAGKIRPARLQAYLASELRGQLLQRNAVVRINDRVARGRARKLYVVEPRPYLGQPLDAWTELEIPGFERARLELYAIGADEDRRGRVALSCGGTVVLDDVAEIDGVDQPRQPWSGGLFEGIIDFPDLHVSPGSRRGFAHNEPVAAFLDALSELEAELVAFLEQERRRRVALKQEHLARRIRKQFRHISTRLPGYDFFDVRGTTAARKAPAGAALAHASSEPGVGGTTTHPTQSPHDASGGPDASTIANAPDPKPDEDECDVRLFPPGPLASVQVRPKRIRVPPLATRSLRARCLDEDQRPCSGDTSVSWSLRGPGELTFEGESARYTAPDTDALDQGPATIHVVAIQGDTTATTSVPVHFQGADAAGADQGIPEPSPISAPGQPWRSRLIDSRWEFNIAHRDYLEASQTEARRLRYLVNLLAKEVVLRNFGGPGDAEVLERMVEVLTYLERG